jgi:hypothetical protein
MERKDLQIADGEQDGLHGVLNPSVVSQKFIAQIKHSKMQVLRLSLAPNHPSGQKAPAGSPGHAPNLAQDDMVL